MEYPPVGFHFLVDFEIFSSTKEESRFKEVSGLSSELEMETRSEGGENRFIHSLPKRSKYNDLELKRGLKINSLLVRWCQDAIERHRYHPTNIIISLLNEKHQSLQSWKVIHAYPIHWSASGFNAETSNIVIETIKLRYRYFTPLEP